MKYPKAFENWWTRRKNTLHNMPPYVYTEIKDQCYRAWVSGRNYEKDVFKIRNKLKRKVVISSMESDFNEGL
jgi:hypothetical protein